MTKLEDVRKTKKVTLPSYKIEIVLHEELLTGEVNQIRKAFDNDDDRGLETIRLHIKSWPFVDNEEKPVPITIENINKLPMKDTLAILTEIGVSNTEEEGKKKMNSKE